MGSAWRMHVRQSVTRTILKISTVQSEILTHPHSLNWRTPIPLPTFVIKNYWQSVKRTTLEISNVQSEISTHPHSLNWLTPPFRCQHFWATGSQWREQHSKSQTCKVRFRGTPILETDWHPHSVASTFGFTSHILATYLEQHQRIQAEEQWNIRMMDQAPFPLHVSDGVVPM